MKKDLVKKSITFFDYLVHLFFIFFYGFVKYIPSPLGEILRFILVYPFAKTSSFIRIYEGVTFWYPYRIKIGVNATINEWVYLNGFGTISIGDNVRIGHRTSIITSDHIYINKNIPIYKQGLVSSKVIIEDDVWIGCNVTILKGVKIGKGSIIGANSLVAKSIPPNTIVGGNPLKFLKKR